MEGYESKPDHIILQGPSGNYSIPNQDYVIGISIEILRDSDEDSLKYGIGETPVVPLAKGEGARGYGGFSVCGIPNYYRGSFKWIFDNGGSGLALLIVTRLVPIAKTVQ